MMTIVTKDSTTMITSNRNRNRRSKFKQRIRNLKRLSQLRRRKSGDKTQVNIFIN